MTLVFVGVLLLALSWIRALPVFVGLPHSVHWVFAGVVLIVVGLRRTALWSNGIGRRTALAVLCASLLGASWLPGHSRIGLVLLSVAALLALVPLPRWIRRSLLPGVWVSGAVCAAQAALVPLLYVFSARYHSAADLPIVHNVVPGYPEFPWLAYLLYPPLKFMNPGLALNGGTLYVQTVLDTQPLTPTWEKLGLFPILLFFAGAALIVALRPDWRRRLLGLLLWTALYAYVRLLVLFIVVVQIRNEKVFWLFDDVFWSFLPLPLLLGFWWRVRIRTKNEGDAPADGNTADWLRLSGAPKRQDEDFVPFSRGTRAFRVITATVFLAGGLTAYWGFHDPGARKQGRVLIDESHSNWEWTTQPFDTTWYGGRSGYNYYCLADYWNHYYHVETRRDSLTTEVLRQWDVLVVKTPTSAYSPAEVEAIVRFVHDGGGLFLIGDHTNVFGTSTHLNAIAERFGMYFRYDATYKLANLGLSVFQRPERFAHPVVRFMPQYMFATSCTLYSPLMSENVILGYGLRAMYLDYSETSYFPTKQEKLDYDFGLFVQAGGVKYGKGRVLGYTDSTCFSNFFMFMPGKPELALASLEWLDRANRWAWLGRVFLVIAFAGLLGLVVEGRRNSGAGFWNAVIASSLVTVVLLGAVLDASVRTSYATPQPRRPLTIVTFDQGHGNYSLPVETLPVTNWQDFQTFYVWTQRLGLAPRNAESLDHALAQSRALVEIHPGRPFSIAEVDSVVDFVRRGGTLVVLDSPENPNGTTGALLGPFAISFENGVVDSLHVLGEAGDTLGKVRKGYSVKDVAPLWKYADGRVAMGYRPFEKGKVVVCGAAYLFSTEIMGNTAVVPNRQQRALFQAEYELFTRLAGLSVTGRYRLDRPPSATGTSAPPD